MSKDEHTALLTLPIILLVAGAAAVAGSQGSVSALGLPLFALGVVLAFAIQWVAFVPAYLLESERFFDLVGSVTYITVAAVVVYLAPQASARSFLLLALTGIWALRLGTYLARRVHRAGKDGRFDEIKVSFVRFLNAWTLQGLWVVLTLGAGLAAMTATSRLPLDAWALAGALVWVLGFTFEVVADLQKSRFRADPANADRFIRNGLWAWSRHPNYFGEIVLWVGVALIAYPVLGGWQLVTLISPVFVALLLTKVSGIPLLEKRAEEKWGGQPDYEAYKANTPVLVPRPPSL